MTVVFSPQARADLSEVYEYIRSDNPKAADKVLAHIVEVIGLLATDAMEGRSVVLRDGRQVQTWPVPPYRIYYRKNLERFEVLRVYHQARRPIEKKQEGSAE